MAPTPPTITQWQPLKGTRVIGLGHKARQGKDTAANFLRDQYGACKFSFATGLYTVARALFGMQEKDAPLLQALGTEVGRKNDNDRWIRTLYWQIKDENPSLAVIPDMRFPNELNFIRAIGGSVVKISRLSEDGSPFVAPDRSPTHPSEIALDDYTDWDLQITAFHGDLGPVRSTLASFMESLK